MAKPTDLTSDQNATDQINSAYVNLLYKGQGSSTEEQNQNTRSLTYPDFTYRHEWGDKNGWWVLTLRDSRIRPSSNVFISLSEVEPIASTTHPIPNPFIGSARFSVYNVAPSDGAVAIRVHIDWPNPLPVQVSYLIINP